MPSFFIKTPGGAAADHPAPPRRVLYAAPTDADDHNTLRLDLFPIACWCAGDVRFAFDSSLVKPELAEELARLDALRRSHPRAPLSIFGHADPVGEDAYNKVLSGRRATAIYALLTRRVDLWEDLYSNSFGGDAWGTRSLELMLATVQDPRTADSERPEGARPYFEGPPSGARSAAAIDAIRRFQQDKGLTVDGVAGPITRRALFLAHMDTLCRGEDGLLYTLDPVEDFLGRGGDPGGKGDYQGCGELNPTLVLSAAEREALARPEHRALRDLENAPNRRVMAFLFRPGARVSPARWPCPRAGEGDGACRRYTGTEGPAIGVSRPTWTEAAKRK
jgi:hypothetical protein